MNGERPRWVWTTLLVASLVGACSGGQPPPALPLSGTFEVGAALNPDRDGRSSPVFVRVYQLSSKQAFTRASFEDLQRRDEQVLAKDLLHRELLQFCPLQAPEGDAPQGPRECRGSGETLTMELNPEARYLAAFAEFYDYRTSGSQWRAILDLPPADDPMFGGPRMPPFRVSLTGTSVSLAFE